MKCEFCNADMRLDDVDFNYTGNMDKYWECDKCHASALIKIRYGEVMEIEFTKGEEL